MLEEFHVQRVGNVVMYNAAISACERGAHWQLALALLVQAEMESIQLDTITYNASWLRANCIFVTSTVWHATSQ